MKEIDKKEIRQIFNEGINEPVIPHFDKIYYILTDHTKILDKHTEILEDHTYRLIRIEKKEEAKVDRDDRQDQDIKQIKEKIKIS